MKIYKESPIGNLDGGTRTVFEREDLKWLLDVGAEMFSDHLDGFDYGGTLNKESGASLIK